MNKNNLNKLLNIKTKKDVLDMSYEELNVVERC